MSNVVATGTHLAEAEWHGRRRRHEERVQAWTAGHRARRARGEKHPVEDFLFEYYRFRPAWLARWHPGPDITLGGGSAREFLRWPEYQETPDGVALNLAAFPPARRETVAWLLQLLRRSQERPPQFGCFGLHEWAMVYRLEPGAIRHSAWPLRLKADDIARVVEAQPLRCTHFDAFRFFTPAARPLNRLQPARPDAMELEQGGCLHANMDLYKWSFKLAPFSPGDLVADCFELARDIRVVDMRASPYDFRALGCEPIAIEAPAGRTEYEAAQREFAERSVPLRERLIALCERLIGGKG
ncbi:MAG TPA: 3-methyladenine DNA glycosylase [Candidatus Didemnitutus sp.]|jgi:hypothetical protein